MRANPRWSFLTRTALYFVILLGLVYLYGYYGAGQAPIIYNEF